MTAPTPTQRAVTTLVQITNDFGVIRSAEYAERIITEQIRHAAQNARREAFEEAAKIVLRSHLIDRDAADAIAATIRKRGEEGAK